MTDAEMDRFGLFDGDLLFGRRSLVEAGAGKCSLVEGLSEPTTFESSIIRVRVDKDRLRPRFIYYWLKSHFGRGTIRAIVTGTTVKGIKGSVLKDVQILCPPTETQDIIIENLRAYDDLIENNRRRICCWKGGCGLIWKGLEK
jgi:type I restriction enzyme S subunit